MNDHEIRVMEAQLLAIDIMQIIAGHQVGIVALALGMVGGHFAATVPNMAPSEICEQIYNLMIYNAYPEERNKPVIN